MKLCNTCGKKKPANRTKNSGFSYRRERNNYYPDCKECKNAYARSAETKRKRHIRTREAEAIERNPHGFLAVDIIVRAVRDWQRFGHITEKISMGHSKRTPTDLVDATSMARRRGYETIREELLAFFASGWFEMLCDIAGVGADFIRKNVLEGEDE